MAFAMTFVPPAPIPMRRGPLDRATHPKLAFMPGAHPAFEAARDEPYPNTDRYAMEDQDNTMWAGAYRGFVEYPREICADNRPSPPIASSDSVTRWSPETGVVGITPLRSRVMNANFFASDPLQFKSNGGGFVCGIGGGGISLGGMVPSGAWSFLTPGTPIVAPVYTQTYKAGVLPTMTTKDFQASTIYNPLPSFSTTVPSIP